MNYTINWITKIITPTDAPISGAITVDVQDLYSRWVDWMLTSDNSKYLQAMRIIWGDPLPGSKQLGITYFLLNWWKIKPYEATHVFILNGNLYSEDWSTPFQPTAGAYNVTIISSVSNLVDSTVQQLPEIEYASFNGRVTIDIDNGVAGVTYPIGTPTNPVNNLDDAILIAVERWFKILEIKSELTVTTGKNIDEYTIRSDNWLPVTIESGVSLLNTNFEKVSLYGEMSSVWNVLIDCWTYDITNFSGWVRWGSIGSVALSVWTISAEFGWQSFFDDIVPLYPWNISEITMNTDTQVSFTNCSDVTTIKSMTTNSTINCGLLEWKLIIDSSCTWWTIVVWWVGILTNNSALTINDDALVSPDKVATKVWTNPTRTLTSWWWTGEWATPQEIWEYPNKPIILTFNDKVSKML